jgi:MFS family permease
MVLLALFGAVMGQGVIWYTGQFYAQTFLEKSCFLSFEQSRVIMLIAIAFATPFFLVFGWLSDRIGRKWIMMAGLLGGILFYRPIFSEFLKETNVKEWVSTGEAEQLKHIIKVDTISNRTDVAIGEISYDYKGITFTKKDTSGGWTVYPPLSALGQNNTVPEIEYTKLSDTNPGFKDVVLTEGLKWKFIFLVWVMILFVTMVYGPIAAFLVEMFPTRIRYTSMSLPYHIGNGVFGGLVPFIGVLLTTSFPGDPLVGLWYPIGVAALCLVIGTIYLRNKIDQNIND